MESLEAPWNTSAKCGGAVEFSPDGISDSVTGGLGERMEDDVRAVFHVDDITSRDPLSFGYRSAVSFAPVGPPSA